MRLAAGQEINFARRGRTSDASSKSNPLPPAGARSSRSSRPSLHKGKPHCALLVEANRRTAAATPTAASRCATRAAATSSTTASSTSSATRTASRPRSSGSNTIRTAARTSRCCCYADGERRYVIAQKGVSAGAQLMSGLGSADQGGQHAAAAEHPGRHHDLLHRDDARQGRADRARGRHRRAAARARRRIRAAPAALRRDPQGARRLPRDDRRSRQRGALAASRSARPGACAGAACARRCAAWR